MTGLADTQIDLIRDKPSWFPPGKTLQLPTPLLEIRHRIVHRHLPTLAELKRAAQDSLTWLWEWYWSQLDHAFGVSVPETNDIETESLDTTRERLQTILKAYVKERIAEIKSRKKESRAAQSAVSNYTLRYAPSATSVSPARSQKILLHLLVDEKMILPTDKKMGTSMSGAFLIWDAILLAFVNAGIVDTARVLESLSNAMNAPRNDMVSVDMDAVKEGMYEWISHVLLSSSYEATNLVESTLTTCFSEPTYWNIRIAEKLLESGNMRDKEAWREVLKASRDEDMEMEVEGGEVKEVGMEKTQEKIKGPVKVIGMWKPRPIGWMEGGWEDDE
jgi:ribosomal biogenesis protein LAS1